MAGTIVTADLTFNAPAFTGPATAVDLTFGADTAPSAPVSATLSARFALGGSLSVNCDNAVFRGPTARLEMRHQVAAERHRAVAAPWQPTQALRRLSALPWQAAQAVQPRTAMGWQHTRSVQRLGAMPWQPAAAMGAQSAAAWGMAPRAERVVSAPWQAAQVQCAHVVARHGHTRPMHHHLLAVWQTAQQQPHVVRAPFNRLACLVHRATVAPWQQALTLASHGGPRYLAPPPVIQPPRPPVVVDLQFCAVYPDGGHPRVGLVLVLGANPCGAFTPEAPLYILPARFYMAVHDVAAYLLPGNEPVPIFNLQLGADIDSTVWTFSANTPFAEFDALTPASGVPRLLRVVVDGLEWVFMVDGLAQTHQFGQRGARISGRSATAMVGQPYARETSRLNLVANNAQQLALDALQYSGVGLDWGIADWLVPIGAWSHTGTPLAAVQAIAQAAGGYINSHRSAATVLVRHPYPTLPGGIPGGPWNWEGAAGAFDADVELAPDAIISRGVERMDGPDIDGIYVSGTTTGGIEAHIKRTGTLGAKLAQPVADALITAIPAATQRGYSVLGQAGAKHKVTLTLPVLVGGDNPGVLDVGQLVQVNDAVPWRGRVRGVSVSFNRPTLRQSVTLERHLS